MTAFVYIYIYLLCVSFLFVFTLCILSYFDNYVNFENFCKELFFNLIWYFSINYYAMLIITKEQIKRFHAWASFRIQALK